MSDLAIVARDVGKEYRLGAPQVHHNTLRDALASSAGRLWSSMRSLGPPVAEREWFWALRDVSFELRRGEVLGVVGSNGAGKSTLLKILSRITEPTTGEIALRGRVASLLEVGTGFHSELTGRENVFLNGAILGMTRSEITRKFDEIVAFAEVERFIDTPVKHYSTGMHLRLGFSVAAHLEPEILIVDEVLAVGDAKFQKKCLGKMESVATQKRTVIFVSHNLDAVRDLCSRCLLIEGGLLKADGPPEAITARYSGGTAGPRSADQWHDISGLIRTGTGEARLRAVRYRSIGHGDPRARTEAPFEVTFHVRSRESVRIRCLSVMILDPDGRKLLNAELSSRGDHLDLHPGDNQFRVRVHRLHLNPGTYVLGCWMAREVEDAVPVDYLESAASFEVISNSWEAEAEPWAIGPVSCDFAFEGLEGGGPALLQPPLHPESQAESHPESHPESQAQSPPDFGRRPTRQEPDDPHR